MGDYNRSLSLETILQIQEGFSSFDPRKTGLVPTRELGPLMRTLGYNPTKEELQDLVMEVDGSCLGYLKLPDFLDMMSKILDKRNCESEIEIAFRCFDRHGVGFVTRTELMHIFQNIGVKLTEEEIEELLTEADVDKDGLINYEEFIYMASVEN
ncbi:calmodulin-A [Eurytemora carolleeae]|uniref:calmodulin-A n=1 Tax=Eurytemora carolleeae TaxID=1294199 RepID=UPI000C76E2E1|nr:calmodulin-A [Eurytemora carolleeae]XP_023326164.1 calmodulin-A [Eurytemora carolleeae]|eukprot:XP_023326163.1 calmodulin-A-like [Eurytemora affinis]